MFSEWVLLRVLRKYRVIYKSLWDFRPLRYSSRDGHAEGEHVNRGTDTPSFCPTLQVLHMCTLGDAADVNPVIKFLRYALQRVSLNSCMFRALPFHHPGVNWSMLQLLTNIHPGWKIRFSNSERDKGFVSSTNRQDRLGGGGVHPTFCSTVICGLFPADKTAGRWRWPPVYS
jgi:hypothetical protein